MDNFYLLCLHTLVMALKERFHDIRPREKGSQEEHLLWMAEQMWYWKNSSWKQKNFFVRFFNFVLRRTGVQLYDTALVQEAAKAGRWLGWMLREAEELGLWDNKVSREYVHIDVLEGRDIPY